MKHWGGTVQYEGYFLMRWLGEIGGDKCGGGWYDWLGTTESNYVEQARQTILAGARETMLFCYGGLNPAAQSELPPSIPWPTATGQADTAALRANMPELLATAREVQKRQPWASPPTNRSTAEAAANRVFDFLGMMGLPLVPCHQFPTNAPAAFFSVHAFDDPNAVTEINDYIKTGRPVLMTECWPNYCRPGSIFRRRTSGWWPAAKCRIICWFSRRPPIGRFARAAAGRRCTSPSARPTRWRSICSAPTAGWWRISTARRSPS
jgi:hypothetical protein